MSRSHYYEGENWGWICWRGAVKSAIRGRRGQTMLRELRAALDALPEPKLIADELSANGAYCALGALGAARELRLDDIDPHEPAQVAKSFDIACALAQEIVFINDEEGPYRETPEERFKRVRRWVESEIRHSPREDQ